MSARIAASILASLSPHQLAVVRALASGERYVALCCGRRAGKTRLLSALVLLYLLRAKRGQEVVFAAPTLGRGMELIWLDVCEMLDTHKLAWRRHNGSGKLQTPAGGTFRIVGLDHARDLERFARGGNTMAFMSDESSLTWRLLDRLLVAAGPALAQSRGAFLAAGTPGQVESGTWYEVCRGAYGFTAYHWTLADNPFLGREPVALLAEERERNGWAEDHPTYVTEYLGEWITNPSLLVLELERGRNAVDAVPGYDRARWRHFVGIDYGFSPDPSAWVVLAAHPQLQTVYVVHAEQHGQMDSSQIAAKTRELAERYRPVRIAGDSASGGSTFMADYNRRWGNTSEATIQPARKADKLGGIALLNTDLRLGRLLVDTNAAPELYDELVQLQWEDLDRQEILSGPLYPDHLFDALRYAWAECTAFAHSAPIPFRGKSEEDRIAARNLRAQKVRRWT